MMGTENLLLRFSKVILRLLDYVALYFIYRKQEETT